MTNDELRAASCKPRDLVRAVILAGGSGSRLWPLSRQQFPKQFLHFGSAKSLLQETIDRLHPLIEVSDVLIVTSEEYANGEAYLDLLPYESLLEPVARNTAPAIAVAAAYLHDAGNDPIMVVLPADHVITDHATFRAALSKAIQVARDGVLVTFGIKPTRCDTGFGYIKVSKPRQLTNNHEVTLTASDPSVTRSKLPTLAVEQFTEKPDADAARRFLQDGNYYWNSGMFVWRTSAILGQIEQHLPEVHAVLNDMRVAWKKGQAFGEVMKQQFKRMPSISIDYGVLEKSKSVVLIPCEFGWSDVGSWDAVHEILPHDPNRNVIEGNVLSLDCSDTLIFGGKRLVAAIGLKDLCVIETADAILIAKRGETQRVRELVDHLHSRDAKEQLVHRTVQRPWGTYTVLEDESKGYKLKRIEVRPGGCLSLQRHQHRSEHWVVVSGTATVLHDGKTMTVSKNESTYIPIGVKHRLENRGKIPLQIVEIQVGEYLEEDDIERFDDTYGRG